MSAADMGKMIKGVINRKCINQEELARMMSVTPSTVSNWISGKRVPRIKALIELAEVLEISVDDLFNEYMKK